VLVDVAVSLFFFLLALWLARWAGERFIWKGA